MRGSRAIYWQLGQITKEIRYLTKLYVMAIEGLEVEKFAQCPLHFNLNFIRNFAEVFNNGPQTGA